MHERSTGITYACICATCFPACLQQFNCVSWMLVCHVYIMQLRYLERYSQKATAAATTGRSTVVRVDAAGLPQPMQDAKANRYQCGPFALELGGNAAAAAAAGGGASQQGALGVTQISGGAAGAGMRVRKRGGSSMVNACFGGDE